MCSLFQGLGSRVRLPTVLIFDLAAPIYDWFTAQPLWWSSCARLARDVPPDARVLDLGVGPGVSAIVLARVRPDARVIGLDLAAGMLVLAQRRGSRVLPGEAVRVRRSPPPRGAP